MSTLSQISCFPSINRERKAHLSKSSSSSSSSSSLMFAPSRYKFAVRMHLDGNGTQTPASETETTLRYGADAPNLHAEGQEKSYPVHEEPVAEKMEIDESLPTQEVVASKTKTAKIHDFCLGIPYGGLVLSGGLVGSLFTRNLSTLGNGVLYGGGLLALSIYSLKVWRQEKSSLPFILGQAALAVLLLWKHLQNYFLTKKVFPSGFYAVISTAMLCFYSYVVASGGNPPSKKLKIPTSPPS